MTSRSSAQTRPPGPGPGTPATAVPARIAGGPRAPVRSLSAHHIPLAGAVTRAGPHGSGSGSGSGSGVAAGRRPELVIDLTTTDTDPGRPRSADEPLKQWASTAPATPATASPNPLDAGAAGVKGNADRRARPRMRFVEAAAADGDSAVRTASAAAAIAGPQVPFPPRPGPLNSSRALQLQQAIQNVRLCKSRKAHGVPSIVTLDPPYEARKFPGGKPADFSPWTGSQVEDHLTDKFIKSGFQSTPLVSVHDSNTARPSLWSSLKHKSGLSTLSTLFCTVLERRQQLGKLTAPSTFKPPPRVALTDKSRENWLLELANPNVPLRRLSRRIPHGIRGKGLLEECMTKDIPFNRAVWLAKCVGANEMRAFKRKGAGASTAQGIGGEAKWVREWTGHVQQFLESVIGACGQKDWMGKIVYAMKLVFHLYNEHLLDQEQFLEWILASLDTSTTESLPLWLAVTRLYWKDLSGTRRRGTRLAEALLEQANRLDTPENQDIDAKILQHLKRSLVAVMLKHDACLILPKSWKKYQDTIKNIPQWNSDARLPALVDDISRRNSFLARPGGTDGGHKNGPRKMLLKLLDESFSDPVISFDFRSVAASCSMCGLSDDEMVKMTLRWACSTFRSGSHHVHLAVRMLQHWNAAGIDTDSAILDLLTDIGHESGFDERVLFKIVAELCRSRHFSVGRYLQWFIASGSVIVTGTPGPDIERHKRLLAELPMHNLPGHLVNLLSTLLRDVGIETEAMRRTVQGLQARIGDMSKSEVIDTANLEALALNKQSHAVKFELSHWLRAETKPFYQSVMAAPKITEEKPTESRISTITPSQIYLVRRLLEDLDDIHMLSLITYESASSPDWNVLVACADTLNLHSRSFAALGASRALFDALVHAYVHIRATQTLERQLVYSMLDLASTIGADAKLVQQLKLDLGRCEQRAAVAMCSPASDGMGDVSLAGRGDASADEEIERILGSGTNMDEGQAGRVFARIVGRMAEQLEDVKACSPEHSKSISPYDVWLQKLRSFDERIFDRLMSDWITGILLEQQPGSSALLSFALPLILGAGVADLAKIVASTKKIIDALGKLGPHRASGAALSLLMTLVPGAFHVHPLLQQPDQDRFTIEQSKQQSTMLELAMPLLDLASKTNNTTTAHIVDSLTQSEGLLGPLRIMAVTDIEKVAEILRIGTTPATSVQNRPIDSILRRLFNPCVTTTTDDVDKQQTVRHIIDSADDFSLPFCQLQIRHLLRTPSTGVDDVNDSVDVALLDAIKAAIERESTSWADLLAGFGDDVCAKVRQFAEQRILTAASQLREKLGAEELLLGRNGQSKDTTSLHRYLSVVDAATSNSSCPVNTQYASLLAETIKALAEALEPSTDEPFLAESTKLATVCEWIAAMVHLSIIHQRDVLASSSAEQLSFVSSLCSLLTNHRLQQSPRTVEALFDVLALLSDDLPLDVRTHISSTEVIRSRGDSRLQFLFGSSAAPEAWLGLVTSMSSASVNTTSAPKASNVATSPVSSTPTAASPMQRTPAQQYPQTPPLQRQMSQMQQSTMQAPQMQRNSSQPRPHPSVHPPNPLPQRPGMPQINRGGMTQYATVQQQAQQVQVQARQAQQGWQQAQQSRLQQRPQTGPNQAQSLQQQQAAQPHTKVLFNPPVPFPLRRWEILPDASASGAGMGNTAKDAAGKDKEANDTAISLSLFAARKVV